MHGPAFEIHAGFVRHPALQLLIGQVIALAVLDEHGTGLDETEGNIGLHALLPQGLYPVEIAGAAPS